MELTQRSQKNFLPSTDEQTLWERKEVACRKGQCSQAGGAGRWGPDRRNNRGKAVQDPGLGDDGTVFKEREASTWSSGAPKDWVTRPTTQPGRRGCINHRGRSGQVFWPVITEQGQLPSTWFYDPSLLDKLAESKGQRRPPPRFRACTADPGSTQRFTKARPQKRHHTD